MPRAIGSFLWYLEVVGVQEGSGDTSLGQMLVAPCFVGWTDDLLLPGGILGLFHHVLLVL